MSTSVKKMAVELLQKWATSDDNASKIRLFVLVVTNVVEGNE